jgi:hypothetical protein
MADINADAPKIWKSPEEILAEQELNKNQELMIPEEPSVPTLPIEDRLNIIDKEASDNDKGILNALVEVSKTANVLKQIDNEETQEGRNLVLKAWYDAFIQNKMQNSHTIEKVIAGLADRLLNNIDSLDLEQTGILIEKLSNVNAIMAQRNPTTLGDPTYGQGGQPAVNLTINNATAEGASINNPTLNVGGRPPVQNLDSLNSLNNAMTGWKGAPKKVTPVMDVEGTNK